MASQRIVFDLDGVLRDLQAYLLQRLGVPYPHTWFWTHHDKDIFDLVREDGYNCLVYAPATPYYVVLKRSGYPVELWTYQRPEWQPYTALWIRGHFGDTVTVRYLTPEQKREELDKHPELLLVEDYPNFPNYKQIVLIDRPWNQNVTGAPRIHFLEELAALLASGTLPE